ncbi:hypothetical protein [Streptomyces sp. NPDC059949]|uniref:hypothetical protein n=1 Tax=Streptomyces sp. NPDC059949 TaxID=3347013 RepID=UPI003650C72C
MIGEPELDGQWETRRPAEIASDGEPRARLRGLPWWWVPVAVVATCAVWAGGLYAFGDRLAEPEIRYRVTENLCDQLEAPALAGMVGGLPQSTPHPGGRYSALDWAQCGRDGGSAQEGNGLSLLAVVELHKKTDPAAEFEAGSRFGRMYGAPDGHWKAVPGLGEQAFIGTPGTTDDELMLRVRDGGAVFAFNVRLDRMSSGDPDVMAKRRPRPDQADLTAALIEDARALMSALRKD